MLKCKFCKSIILDGIIAHQELCPIVLARKYTQLHEIDGQKYISVKEIMKPGHPRWDEFCKRLEGPEGCDFKKDNNGEYTWKCKGGNDKTFAMSILKTMPEIDIEASLEFFDNNGGHCDCEILFNVDNC